MQNKQTKRGGKADFQGNTSPGKSCSTRTCNTSGCIYSVHVGPFTDPVNEVKHTCTWLMYYQYSEKITSQKRSGDKYSTLCLIAL